MRFVGLCPTSALQLRLGSRAWIRRLREANAFGWFET